MPCKQLGCESIKELLSLIENECKGAGNIFVLCTGAEDTSTGKSWCPDCVKGITFLIVWVLYILMRNLQSFKML